MSPEPIELTSHEIDALLAAADLVALGRTAVETDPHGNILDAHAPEMPTRFAKQLAQVVRGAVAIGMGRDVAIRCARDSMPPLRLAIIDYLATHPHMSTAEVRKALNKPRNTIDRQLQAMHMLGLLDCDEMEYSAEGVTRVPSKRNSCAGRRRRPPASSTQPGSFRRPLVRLRCRRCDVLRHLVAHIAHCPKTIRGAADRPGSHPRRGLSNPGPQTR